MRINTAIIISGVTLGIGYFFNQPYLWVPLSVLVAGFIDLFTRNWVASDRFGSARALSAYLKFFFALVGFYAMLGQIACIALIIYWVI